MSWPTTSGTFAVAAGAVVVPGEVVAVVVFIGAVVTPSRLPFEMCNVTVAPLRSCEPPPGACETTIPRGRDAGSTNAFTP
jgi:hypothetical protein